MGNSQQIAISNKDHTQNMQSLVELQLLSQQLIFQYFLNQRSESQSRKYFLQFDNLASMYSLQKGEHITAIISSESNEAFSQNPLVPQDPEDPLFDAEQSLNRAKVNSEHLKNIQSLRPNNTYSIVHHPSAKLVSKTQLMLNLKEAFEKSQKQFHRFIFSGPSSSKNGSMIIKTTYSPQGQELKLREIFDLFFSLQSTRHKSIVFMIDSHFSSRLAIDLFYDRIQSLTDEQLGFRKVKIQCSSGVIHDKMNMHQEKYGSLLIFHYLAKKMGKGFVNSEEQWILAPQLSMHHPMQLYHCRKDNCWKVGQILWEDLDQQLTEKQNPISRVLENKPRVLDSDTEKDEKRFKINFKEHITVLYNKNCSLKHYQDLLQSTMESSTKRINKSPLFGVEVDMMHIQEIIQKMPRNSNSIIEAKATQKVQILSSLKQSFKHKKLYHRFIFTGNSSEQNGSMLIQTEKNKEGEQLTLWQVYETFASLDETRNKSIIFMLDSCQASEKMISDFKWKIERKTQAQMGFRKVRVLCSNFDQQQSIERSRYGGLLICRYWSKKLGGYLFGTEEEMFRELFQQTQSFKLHFDEVRSKWELGKLKWIEEREEFY